ncbi:hypothetical protein COU62_03040 [Candidatus Pacearchaeota archaeon CG10_big_fil_rev_8_21_14_0_10_35_219]|nr:hypothetical protein [Candidatus Pacearchaeota archaeon]OIO43478.1 MAG: hypothetical protein AUJ63_00035 [Candidatus Pacearchaeota archaeon CG1_02_35_32]PIO07601.1 MAG: hypothetical protein COU62_03040 [Candidatus Pacearchaeota archaeon CG10_big_fil_rev_8_21_14_0_10_35_219]PIY81835.1 MAG: hypothetical protein COY79_00520 [Candidatus Pacearchaeota archaeon CG_4_10_14_0_8_um_filter_35_169]PIZ80701.1 MAG: hypothetical protein COY00_00465 [Candidatus Pacearchaeota archaeon CG_4_10_14_0_2_um_filt
MISNQNLEKTKQEIKKASGTIIVQAQDDRYNRKILEYGKFNILLSPESGFRKDKLKTLDSGLNHVLAKIATKNKIAIGINLQEIKKLQKKEKAERIARIKQNIKICKKAKTKIKVLNYNNKKQAQSLLLSLGASTLQVKEAVL